MARNGDIVILFIFIFSGFSGGFKHECDRECLREEHPRECYYHFTIGINYRSRQLAINGETPGPAIIACQNDTIIVDVRNFLPDGLETSIHWHGFAQNEEPYMDGVPMITQCPILSKSMFQYKFRAIQPGSYYYHAHSVFQQIDGLFGAFIIREPKTETLKDSAFIFFPRIKSLKTLDNDIESNHNVADIQIHQFENHEENDISPKRIRLINAAAIDCPINIFTNFVHFKQISMDGHDIQPIDVTNVLLYPGERTDIITKWDVLKIMRVIGYNSCKGYEKYGLSSYASGERSKTGEIINQPPNYAEFLKSVKSRRKEELKEADVKFYIQFDDAVFSNFSNEVDFKYKLGEAERDLPSFLSSRKKILKIPQINGKTFLYPPSPTLTQMEDIPDSMICSMDTTSSDCDYYLKGFCECLQILNVPYNKSVDIILIDQGKNSSTPQTFHIHGYSFQVLGIGSFDEPINAHFIKKLDAIGEIKRNLVDPVTKDTVLVPNKGYVVLRLFTSNLGDWLIESITSKSELGIGLELLMRVEDSERSLDIPEKFPKCGTYKPPDLIFGE